MRNGTSRTSLRPRGGRNGSGSCEDGRSGGGGEKGVCLLRALQSFARETVYAASGEHGGRRRQWREWRQDCLSYGPSTYKVYFHSQLNLRTADFLRCNPSPHHFTQARPGVSLTSLLGLSPIQHPNAIPLCTKIHLSRPELGFSPTLSPPE